MQLCNEPGLSHPRWRSLPSGLPEIRYVAPAPLGVAWPDSCKPPAAWRCAMGLGIIGTIVAILVAFLILRLAGIL